MAKIQVTKKGVFFLYIPLAITEAMGWKKGTVLTCEILGKGKLKLEETKEEKKECPTTS